MLNPRHILGNLRTLKVAAMALSLMAAVPAMAQYRPDHLPDGPPVPIPNPEIVIRKNATVPSDLQFTTSEGVKVTIGDFFKSNKPVILELVYFNCPNLCGFSQDALVTTVRTGPRGLSLGKDYDVVVVSIDPDDTPALAAAKRTKYLSMMSRPESERGLTYLTGSEDSIRQLADAVGFGYRRNFTDIDTAGKFAHSSGIFVCTPYGKVSQTIVGLDYLPDDLHYALVQATEGKIATGMLGIGLSCGAVRLGVHGYEANPWFWAGTAGGLASMGFTGIFLGIMWRGEWKKKRLDRLPPDNKTAVP